MRWWDALDARQRAPPCTAMMPHPSSGPPPGTPTPTWTPTPRASSTTPRKRSTATWTSAASGAGGSPSIAGSNASPREKATPRYREPLLRPLSGLRPGRRRSAPPKWHTWTRIGQALLGRTDTGVYPADIPLAMRWWNALEPAQRVAALHGDAATPEESTAAERAYEDLDPETKRLVHTATVADRSHHPPSPASVPGGNFSTAASSASPSATAIRKT